MWGSSVQQREKLNWEMERVIRGLKANSKSCLEVPACLCSLSSLPCFRAQPTLVRLETALSTRKFLQLGVWTFVWAEEFAAFSWRTAVCFAEEPFGWVQTATAVWRDTFPSRGPRNSSAEEKWAQPKIQICFLRKLASYEELNYLDFGFEEAQSSQRETGLSNGESLQWTQGYS